MTLPGNKKGGQSQGGRKAGHKRRVRPEFQGPAWPNPRAD